MGKDYVILTENGSYHRITDEGHLFAPDTWVVWINGKKHVILCFGEFQLMRARTAMRKQDGPVVRKIEVEVGKHIRSGRCLGQPLVHIEEKFIAPYLRDRRIPVDIWNGEINSKRGALSKVKEIYEKIH